MILQVAYLSVKPGAENDFESSFRKASGLLSQASGYVRHELHKCVEREGKYILLIRWRGIKNHLLGFRRSEAYEEWRRLLDPYYAAPPVEEHYVDIDLGAGTPFG